MSSGGKAEAGGGYPRKRLPNSSGSAALVVRPSPWALTSGRNPLVPGLAARWLGLSNSCLPVVSLEGMEADIEAKDGSEDDVEVIEARETAREDIRWPVRATERLRRPLGVCWRPVPRRLGMGWWWWWEDWRMVEAAQWPVTGLAGERWS